MHEEYCAEEIIKHETSSKRVHTVTLRNHRTVNLHMRDGRSLCVLKQ